ALRWAALQRAARAAMFFLDVMGFLSTGVADEDPRLTSRGVRSNAASRCPPGRDAALRSGVIRTPETPSMQDNRRVPTSVLIVDDHPSFRLSARRMLEASGFSVIGEAEDGHSALEAVQALGPDLVLLDVQLPDLDGFEVAD